MYVASYLQIGIDYYLENDLKRANYLQRKLNTLAAKVVEAENSENYRPAKKRFVRIMKDETDKLNSYEHTYINSLVSQSQKSEKKIRDCVLADLNRQEERFQTRMLQRIKSAGRL